MKNLILDEELKAKADELKENTLDNLTIQDKEYQRYAKELRAAEKAYLKLHLTKEERDVVDKLLSLMDASNMEYSTLNYLAGVLDRTTSVNAIRELGYTGEEDNSILFHFYSGQLLPQELLKESLKTIKLMEELDKADEELNLLLNVSQQELFQTVIDKRREANASLIKDSFMSYFRLGAKLMVELS